MVDTPISVTPTSTVNKVKACGPEMHQSKMGQAWHFAMKALICVDLDSCVVNSPTGKVAIVTHIVRIP